MKTIKNINEQVETIETNLSEEAQKTVPMFKDMFKRALGMMITLEAQKAIDLYSIGLKFKTDKTDMDLENSEFELLKEACSANPAKWMAFYHAQVMLRLKEAERGE